MCTFESDLENPVKCDQFDFCTPNPAEPLEAASDYLTIYEAARSDVAPPAALERERSVSDNVIPRILQDVLLPLSVRSLQLDAAQPERFFECCSGTMHTYTHLSPFVASENALPPKGAALLGVYFSLLETLSVNVETAQRQRDGRTVERQMPVGSAHWRHTSCKRFPFLVCEWCFLAVVVVLFILFWEIVIKPFRKSETTAAKSVLPSLVQCVRCVTG